MTDKFAAMPPRIAQLLVVIFSPSSAPNERAKALQVVDEYFESIGVDPHEVTERIKTPPTSKEDLKRVFDAGRTQGRAEELAQRQRSVVALASLASGDVDEGHNGYSWHEIVGHCVLDKERIRNNWEANFVQSVAEQLAVSPYSVVTAKQAPILRRIFQSWFNGKIT